MKLKTDQKRVPNCEEEGRRESEGEKETEKGGRDRREAEIKKTSLRSMGQ